MAKRHLNPEERNYTNQKRIRLQTDIIHEKKIVQNENDFLKSNGLQVRTSSQVDHQNLNIDLISSVGIIEIIEKFVVSASDAVIITKMVKNDLNNVVKTFDPSFKVKAFGSHVSGLACSDSDLDFFLQTDQSIRTKDEAKLLMFKTAKAMYPCRQITNIIKIGNARVPVLRFYHKLTKKQCDLSFSNAIGVRNTLLVKYYIKINKNLKWLVLFVKYLLKRYNLHGVHKITTYMLFWLAVFYMQQRNLLPPVEKVRSEISEPYNINEWDCRVPHNSVDCMDDQFSIFHHVEEFMRFYSNFQFLNTVISPYLGCPISAYSFENLRLPFLFSCYLNKVKHETDFTFSCSAINLQDPTEHNMNITKQVTLESLNNFQSFCFYFSHFFSYEIADKLRENSSLLAHLPESLPERAPKECIQYLSLSVTQLRLADNHAIKHTFHKEGVIYLSHIIEKFMQNTFNCKIDTEFSNSITRITRKQQVNNGCNEVSLCLINCISRTSDWRAIVDKRNAEHSKSDDDVPDLLQAVFILESSPSGKDVRIIVESSNVFITYLNFNLLRILQQPDLIYFSPVSS